MALRVVWAQLEKDLDVLSALIRDFAAAKPALDSPSHFSLLDECLLEGILSHIWQVWNLFCRNCVMESCLGTVDAVGTVVVGLPNATSEAHVSGAAICAKKRSGHPYWGTPNTLLRNEPTWGDVDVITNILTRLRPANSPQMLAAFSSGHASARALQLIRNGASHNHVQNVNEIATLRSTYVVFPIVHPTHAMFWIEPKTNDFLVTHAIEKLKNIGYTAISSHWIPLRVQQFGLG